MSSALTDCTERKRNGNLCRLPLSSFTKSPAAESQDVGDWKFTQLNLYSSSSNLLNSIRPKKNLPLTGASSSKNLTLNSSAFPSQLSLNPNSNLHNNIRPDERTDMGTSRPAQRNCLPPSLTKDNALEHANPLKNYGLAATKFLLWRNILNKAEGIRDNRVDSSKKPNTGLLTPGAANAYKRQENVVIEPKTYQGKKQRLRRYAEQLELERGKSYEDGKNAYHDNITHKFRNRMPSIVGQLKLLQETSEFDDETLLNEILKNTPRAAAGLLARPCPGKDGGITRAKGPFDLYSVFEYCHRREQHREFTIRPIGKQELDSYVCPGIGSKKEGARNGEKTLQRKLLRSVDVLLRETVENNGTADKKNDKRSSQQTTRKLKEVLNTSRRLELEDELKYFLATYLPNRRKVVQLKHNKWFVPKERRFKCLENLNSTSQSQCRIREVTPKVFMIPGARRDFGRVLNVGRSLATLTRNPLTLKLRPKKKTHTTAV